MPKINIRKRLDKIEAELSPSLRSRLKNLDNFSKHVVRERWYKIGFLGIVNFLKYSTIKRPFLKNEKRILAVADIDTMGLALGAFIEFAVRLLCEAHIHKIDKIDFAIVYNPQNPVSYWKDTAWITKNNFHRHFLEIFPLLNINPKLDSIFVFNSYDEFEKFYLANSEQYILRPSFVNYINKKAIARGNFAFIRDFYLKYKFLPKLKLSNLESSQIKAILKKQINNRVLVSVNLRTNPRYDAGRNASLEAWSKFFDYCYKKYPDLAFAILGRKTGHLEELKRKPNLIFAQNFIENIQHTLAFINNSFIYMATSCGPASFAILRQDIPYIITSFSMPDASYNYNWFKGRSFFPWQDKERHRIIWEKETPEILIKEFDDLMTKVDKNNWIEKSNFNSVDDSILEWPYLIKNN